MDQMRCGPRNSKFRRLPGPTSSKPSKIYNTANESSNDQLSLRTVQRSAIKDYSKDLAEHLEKMEKDREVFDQEWERQRKETIGIQRAVIEGCNIDFAEHLKKMDKDRDAFEQEWERLRYETIGIQRAVIEGCNIDFAEHLKKMDKDRDAFYQEWERQRKETIGMKRSVIKGCSMGLLEKMNKDREAFDQEWECQRKEIIGIQRSVIKGYGMDLAEHLEKMDKDRDAFDQEWERQRKETIGMQRSVIKGYSMDLEEHLKKMDKDRDAFYQEWERQREESSGIQRSVIKGYIIDFAEHLEKTGKDRDDYMEFYPEWERQRKETIECLEKLLKDLKLAESICDSGDAAAAGVRIAGAAMALVKFTSKSIISPLLTKVRIAGNVVRLGFKAAKICYIFSARKKMRKSLEKDNTATSRLLSMGLRHDSLIRKIEAIIEDLKRMAFSYTYEEVAREMSRVAKSLDSRCSRRSAMPYSAVVMILMQMVQGLDSIDYGKLRMTLYRALSENPDIKQAGLIALQMTRDIAYLSDVSNLKFLQGFSLKSIYRQSVSISIMEDSHDIGEFISKRLNGVPSETQEGVEKALEILRQEYKLLQDMHTELTLKHLR